MMSPKVDSGAKADELIVPKINDFCLVDDKEIGLQLFGNRLRDPASVLMMNRCVNDC